MYYCFKDLCQQGKRTIPLLIHHLRFNHNLSCLETLYCAQLRNNRRCGRRFDSLNSLRGHLEHSHAADEVHAVPHHEVPHEQPNAEALEAVEYHDDNAVNQPDNLRVPLADFKGAIFNSSLQFCAKLYEINNINRQNVQETVTAAKDYLASGFISPLRASISALSELVDGEEGLKSEINLMLSFLENSFNGLETEHLRIKALTESGCYFAPTSYHIADKEVTVFENGHPVPQMIEITGQTNEIGPMIKAFMELEGVLDATLNNMNALSAEDNVLSSILQGKLWREHILPRFNGKIVMPITLYSDSFEADNANGSHSGDHSINSVHFSLPAIPQQYQSSLENIFVTALMLKKHLGEGMEECFGHIIDQLTQLEEEGLEINGMRIYFVLVLVRGDNAGLHNVLGFVECFVANFCCRFCRVHRDVMRQMTILDPALLRTQENY